ncbi:L,D-transpeptidase [Nostoc sp. NIES-2111]
MAAPKASILAIALCGGLALALSGCASQRAAVSAGGAFGTVSAAHYGAITDDRFPIPALDLATIDPALLRQEVAFSRPYRPGTIVVVIGERRLYLVEPGGKAIRYAVGVGRQDALNFRGAAVVGRKASWPTWTPTASMMERIPHYREYAGGLEGGPDNPLGARALYLYRGGRDTHFRLHGTNEPMTIGNAVSSGCIRLFNHDIIDLYGRVSLGTPVIVVGS